MNPIFSQKFTVIGHFLVAALITTVLMSLHTSTTNLIWLASINMPLSLPIIVRHLVGDIITMNTFGEIPLYGLIFTGFIIAFTVAKCLTIILQFNKYWLYILAGGLATLSIVLLMPLAFYQLDYIASARSVIGKVIITCNGMMGGYYFSLRLKSAH